MPDVIVRMPPSPTGQLHLGTARTGLFNYLFAKNQNGKIVFRWEDTDKARSKAEYEAEILSGLKWLGMDFQVESHLFVRQTDSLEKHTKRLLEMWDQDLIFPCFVTLDEIEAQRESAQKCKQNFVFWSPSREIPRAELEERMKSESFSWRIKTPKHQDMIFSDEIRGEVKTNTDTIGDFVVARSDGSVLYLLANVFDDDTEGITHVIRGEDHIANTPKQLVLWQALGIEPPNYAHIPLVLDHKKRKLSKRRVEPGVAVLIPDFQTQGFLPESVLNGLAFLGWNPKTTEEVFTKEELIDRFDLKQVNKASAQYDFEKMQWYNQQWNLRLSLSEIRERYVAWLKVYDANTAKIYNNLDHKTLEAALEITRQKAKTFANFHDEMAYFFIPPEITNDLIFNEKMKVDRDLSQTVLKEIKNMLTNLKDSDFTPENLKAVAVEKIGELGLKNGQFLWPFRTSLSGREKSAGPFEIGAIIGKNEALNRIETALNTF